MPARRTWWYGVALWAALLVFALFYLPMREGVHRGTPFGIVLFLWLPFFAAVGLAAFTYSRRGELHGYQRVCGWIPLALFGAPCLLMVLVG